MKWNDEEGFFEIEAESNTTFQTFEGIRNTKDAPVDIEQAINLISEGEIDYSGTYNCELNERVTEVILNALREQAEREKGCEWCKEDNKVFHDGQHFHMFCSYCGKRLED